MRECRTLFSNTFRSAKVPVVVLEVPVVVLEVPVVRQFCVERVNSDKFCDCGASLNFS
jgi:hypothetical protein